MLSNTCICVDSWVYWVLQNWIAFKVDKSLKLFFLLLFFLQPFLIDFNVVFYEGFIVMHNSGGVSSWKLAELGTAHSLWILDWYLIRMYLVLCVYIREWVWVCVCTCVCTCMPVWVCSCIPSLFSYLYTYHGSQIKDHTQWETTPLLRPPFMLALVFTLQKKQKM